MRLLRIPTWLSFLLIAALAVGSAGMYQEEQEKEIPDTITLDGPRRGPVEFPHILHHDAGYTCQTCHHTMPEEAKLPEQGCRDCHTADATINQMRAFHTTCITCHREYNKDYNVQTPVRCSECHAAE